MRTQALVSLVRVSLARSWKGAAFSVMGVAIGIGALLFFVSLGLGVGKVVKEKVFPVDSTLVDVVPPTLSLGALLGGGKIDQATVDRLGKLPGVAKTYRKMTVRVPAVSRYDGDFFGSRIRMGLEILAVGVDPGLVEKDVRQGAFTDPGEGKPIPALASSRILEIYNQTFAPARKLPRLSPELVIGFEFPVEFNRSFVAATAVGPTTSAQLQIAGVSERALLAGVTIPLDVAVRLNRASNVDAESFTGVTLQAADPSFVPSLVLAAQEMGLEIDDQERRLAQNAGAAISLITSAMALLSVLICLLAAVNIAQALSANVRARAKEIGVLRAVGATRANVRSLIFAEAAVVGAVGGLLGLVGALATSLIVDGLAATYLPPFPFKPDSFFLLPWPATVGGVGLGIVAALGGAFFPSRQAAATDPAKTLAEG